MTGADPVAHGPAADAANRHGDAARPALVTALCLAILDEGRAGHLVEHCLARREHQLASAGPVEGLSRLEQLRVGITLGLPVLGRRLMFSGLLLSALPEHP